MKLDKHFSEIYSLIRFVLPGLILLSGTSGGFCQQPKANKPQIHYVGSSTIGGFIDEAAAVYDPARITSNTGPESAGGEKAILEGRCDIAGVARKPSPQTLASGVQSFALGRDAIAVVVHESNPVKDLSTLQLRDIFTGKIKNWKEVGGADRPIKPYIVANESATHNVFRSSILKEKDYQNCEVVSPDVNLLRKVKLDPDGIGHISFSFLRVMDGLKPISVDGQNPSLKNADYPITRPLYLLYWPNRKRIESFIDWLNSEKSQALIQRRFIKAENQPTVADSQSVINYSGSSTIGIFMQNAAANYRKVDFQLNTKVESSGGEKALLNKTADLGGVARLPSHEVLKAGVISTYLGQDPITVIVHPEIPIKDLTSEQLRDIFAGRITNWKMLGGPDLEIRPFITGQESATHNTFAEIVMKGDAYAGCDTVSPDPDILSRVVSTKGGIGHISLAFSRTDPRVNILSVNGLAPDMIREGYPITRPLYLLWREGNPEVEDFMEWAVSPLGTQVFNEHFVGESVVGPAVVESGEPGTLVVYTQTDAVEDGDVFYYPHRPYEILNSTGDLFRRVDNASGVNDETPAQVILPPGEYLIRTENAEKKYQVIILPGETTRLDPITGKVLGKDELEKKRQEASSNSKLSFNADFRFRVEQDWNSRKSDGSYRDNRTRLRFRARVGFHYQLNDWASFGVRIRTGNPLKQQDPQITLGTAFKEFGLIPMGFEKLYFQTKKRGFTFWTGKNLYPFQKNHEVFWSDNVYPSGVFLSKEFTFNSKLIRKIDIRGGHFLVAASGRSLLEDSYFQGWQVSTTLFDERLVLFPSLYFFKNIPNVPDGADTYNIDYLIFHAGSKFTILKKPQLDLEFDYYHNFQDYQSNDSIAVNLRGQKTGLVTGIKVGTLKKKSDWMFKASFAYLQQFAAVDIFAQNDWARWDYSSVGSPDGRLTNMMGIELVGAFVIIKNLTLKVKYYKVRQLVPYGVALENGDRIRFDIDIKF